MAWHVAQVRAQIAVILQCLQDKDFVDIVRRELTGMVSAFKLELDLAAVTESGGQNALVGTFQEALHHQIIDALAGLFAILLAHMDRNSGLSLYKEHTGLWLYLCKKTFADLGVVERHKIHKTVTMGGRARPVEVPSDGAGRVPFAAQFPFSFFLSGAIESLRETTSTIAAEKGLAGGQAEALRAQFKLLGLEMSLASGALSTRVACCRAAIPIEKQHADLPGFALQSCRPRCSDGMQRTSRRCTCTQTPAPVGCRRRRRPLCSGRC